MQTAHAKQISNGPRLHLEEATAPTVAVVGLGYVGLPTAITFASQGHRVIGIDIDPARLMKIRARRVDLPELDKSKLAEVLEGRKLELATHASSIDDADAVIICIPTPVDEHLVPDLTALRAACGAVVEHARAGQTIILTSTTYVGCTRELLVKPLQERGFEIGNDISVAFAPERINPGDDQKAQQEVPRIVGGASRTCTARATAVVAGAASEVHPVSSLETAEMTKLHENIFRAVNIALANELSDASHALGIDPLEVIEAAATKPYGYMPFYPGPGVGGHCIPCDPHYLLWQLRKERVGAPVVEQAMTAIAERPREVARRAVEQMGESVRSTLESTVLIVGVAYKPGVEDLRESPALEVMEEFRRRGIWCDYHDPLIPSLPVTEELTLMSVKEPVPSNYDLILLVTLHPGHDYDWLEGAPRVMDLTYRKERRDSLGAIERSL